MPAKGQVAQAEEAARRKAQREGKAQEPVESEDAAIIRKLDEALGKLASNFVSDLKHVIRKIVATRTRRLKGEKTELRDAVHEARKLADARRAEIDAQVDRAREAEKRADSLEKRLLGVKSETQADVARLKEIIEEQGATIRVQAQGLREAEKKEKARLARERA